VLINDSLGIVSELETQMQFLVDTYKCEWTEVVNDPERRKWFKQFMNTDETESSIEFVQERGQRRPADWVKDGVKLEQITLPNGQKLVDLTLPVKKTEKWVNVGNVRDFPKDGGATIKYGQTQIAVFRFSSRSEWYATQNMCPHKQAFVLSRGILGDQSGTPKVACPLHKKTYSLENGSCLTGEDYSIRVFPVKVMNEEVYLELPPESELDATLATELHCVRECSTESVAKPILETVGAI
jgi:NAD(P)H-dependent nitrite reductase small subunit